MDDERVNLDPIDVGVPVAGELGWAYPKAGWRTTEFWLSLAGIAAVVVLATVGDADPDAAALAIGTATFGYGVSRGLAKR